MEETHRGKLNKEQLDELREQLMRIRRLEPTPSPFFSPPYQTDWIKWVAPALATPDWVITTTSDSTFKW